MADQVFDDRLDALFREYASRGVRPIDRVAIARAAVAEGKPATWRGVRVPRSWRLAFAAVLMLTVATAGAILVGDTLKNVAPEVVPTPISTPAPTPTPAPTSPPTGIETYDGVPGARFSDPGLATEFLIQLADGRVLGIGESWPTDTQQSLWDPVTENLAPAGLLVDARQQPIAVRLLDGRVLILGGNITDPITVDGGTQGTATYSTAELFHPATGQFTAAGPMVGKGWVPTAVVLADGRVLVLDGLSVDDALGPDPVLKTAEIFDPATNTFSATGSMAIGHRSLTLLEDGRVLALGGWFPESGIVETFDPKTGTFSVVGRLPELGAHPSGGTYWPEVATYAALLPDGRVLIAGRGCMEVHSILPSDNSEGWYPTPAAIFDPTTSTLVATDPMPHCIEHAATLPNGEILLTSFWNTSAGPVYWAGLYDPEIGSIRTTAPPPGGRYIDLLPLADGRVLFYNGNLMQLYE